MSIDIAMSEIREEYLSKTKRVVIKIGSKALSNGGSSISKKILSNLVSSVCNLRKKGLEVILITSGAIVAGNKIFKINLKNLNIVKKQVLSSVGQINLMSMYSEIFKTKGYKVSQLLLTNDIFQDRKRFLNVKTTLLELLKMGIVPIVNENDTVSIDEIMFGDNDILASKVSSMISADSLILLTDTDGLFDKNPKDNSSAKLINTISEDKFDRRVLKDSKKNISFGGMTSKIDAALNVSKYGIPTIIANGMKTKIIDKIFKYENVGTMIIPNIRTIKSRKQWIGMGLKTAGKLLLDDGAIEAIISKGKSLLPSGIKSVEGRFVKGQQVECISISTGQSIARGLTSYSSDELEKIKGKKSNQIVSILGYKYSDEVINRDNMIVDKIK